MKIGLVAMLIMICPFPIASQGAPAPTPAASSSSQVDPAKAARIRRLIDLMGISKSYLQGREMMNQMFGIVNKSAPQDEKSRKFQALLSDRIAIKMAAFDFAGLLTLIYDKFYTLEDINGLIAFYESPIGQKMVQNQIPLMQEYMQTLMPATIRMSQEATEEVYREHPELKPGPNPQ